MATNIVVTQLSIFIHVLCNIHYVELIYGPLSAKAIAIGAASFAKSVYTIIALCFSMISARWLAIAM